jgi:hypothetical protein
MAQKTDAELTLEAQQIRNETNIGANTAVRVGEMMLDLIDSKTNTANGGSGVVIPAPIIDINGNGTSGVINISFANSTFDFSTGNPEIFLMRYKNTRRKMYYVNAEKVRVRRASGYVHPTTFDASVKWQGWKFFNGTHSWIGTTNAFENRVTEWSIPVLIPYQTFQITMNPYLFWNFKNMDNNQLLGYDENFFHASSWYTTSNLADDANYKASVGGNKKNKLAFMKWHKSQEFALVVAIDNPAATKTNNLCPKIFGEMSQPFTSMLVKNNASIISNVVLKLKRENKKSKIRSA